MVKNLKVLRVSKGISQQRLADAIGTSQQSINKYENQSVEPDICTLCKIADFFNVSIDFLVGHVNHSQEKQWAGELELSKQEIDLVRNYRNLSRDEKESIRLVLRNYLNGKTCPKV